MKDEFDNVTQAATPKREKVGSKFVTSYTPLEGENHITGKVPGEPGYKPMTAEQAKQFDAKGNRIGGGAGSVGSGTVDLERGMRGASTKPKVMKKGGKVSSASSRADGCAIKGKTKGRFV